VRQTEAHAQRMSKVDTAWLRMDTEANLMMIVGVWMIRPGITIKALRERIAASLLKYTRFRQKVVEDAMGAHWVLDEHFDIAAHVCPEVLDLGRKPRSAASLERALQARVAELAMQPFDPARPLWQFHLVEDMDGQSALIARIHHCIADGIALISSDCCPPPTWNRQDPRGRAARHRATTLIGSATWRSRRFPAWRFAPIGLAGASASRSIDLMMNEHHPLDSSVHAARLGVQAVSDVAALVLMADDSHTRLKGKPGSTKRVAWADPVPLDAVKAVGKGLNCSINDVLLTCVAGAIGRYLMDKGDAVDGQEIRAMVPVNLRPAEEAYQLGNRFGLVPLVLPIGIENPVERLYAVRARMRELKGSFQPILAFGLLSVAGLLIKPVQHAMLNIFARKATAVMPNVPGPTEPLKFCGSTVERVMFWVPQSGDIGVGVSILTYAGQVQFGLMVDSTLCPDPQAIIKHFEPEFDKLLILALMLPWGEES